MKLLKWIKSIIIALLMVFLTLRAVIFVANLKEAYKKLENRVKLFRLYAPHKKGVAAGTGFLINTKMMNKSTIITTGHFCNTLQGAGHVKDSKNRIFLIRSFKISRTFDLCEVYISETLINGLKIPSNYNPTKKLNYLRFKDILHPIDNKIENITIKLLHPKRLVRFIANGALHIESNGQMKFTVNKGESGSPIFNETGKLLGLVISTDKRLNVSNFVTVDQINYFRDHESKLLFERYLTGTLPLPKGH